MAALRLYQPHLSMAFFESSKVSFVVALHGNDVRAEGHQLATLPLGGRGRDKDEGLETGGSGVARQEDAALPVDEQAMIFAPASFALATAMADARSLGMRSGSGRRP